ncbi:MAG TPA: PD-(D/E)XK nuclease family protein, partial [Victivallales bacterium]|nr:PD-(D/E)XK nuclease family protein [Victivallales bacterium]
MNKVFLNWNKNLISTVVERLTKEAKGKPPDLSSTCVVSQTKNSGKRIKLALANHFVNGFIPPLFVTPDFFLSLCLKEKNIPSQDLIFLWIQTIRTAPKEVLDALKIRNTQNIDIIIRFAEDFCDLRKTLSENAHTINSVAKNAEQFGIEEIERWKAMAELENLYLKNLKENNFEDPEITKINSQIKYEELGNISKIILLALCDPTPLFIRKIEKLAEKINIEIWIHAPPELVDSFDDYGRPLPGKWENSNIEINLENIYIEGNPVEQAELTVKKLIQSLEKPSNSCSIILLNNDLAQNIERFLMERGINTYNPAGYPFKSFSIFYLFKSFYDFLSTNSFESFANFLRNSSVLIFLKSKYSFLIPELLDEIDKFQNESLPKDADLENIPEKYKNIKIAISEIQKLSSDFKIPPISHAIKNFVINIFSSQQNLESYEFNSLVSPDNIFNVLKESINEIKGSALEKSNLPIEEKFYIFLNDIARKTLYSEIKKGAIPLSGWLEAQFDNSNEIILCGVNEGFLPESLSGHVFLPDSVREKIGLRNNKQRFTRDIYLMQSIVKSRKKGAVSCIVGKTNCNEESIMPSRLLFLSDPEELIKRAEKLFKALNRKKYDFLTSELAWKLKVSEKKIPDSLSVSDFKSYIICPFRFYLKKILKMEEYDEKIELDHFDFGEIIHNVLEKFAKEGRISKSQNKEEIRKFLFSTLDKIISHRYGRIPNANV